MKVPSAAGYLIKDIVFDFVRFPVWWYTVGVERAATFAWSELRGWLQRLSLVILFRNLLKPMYGDYSRSGRAISLVLRLFMFVVKFVTMIVWALIVAALFLAWILLPIGIVWLFLRALNG